LSESVWPSSSEIRPHQDLQLQCGHNGLLHSRAADTPRLAETLHQKRTETHHRILTVGNMLLEVFDGAE